VELRPIRRHARLRLESLRAHREKVKPRNEFARCGDVHLRSDLREVQNGPWGIGLGSFENRCRCELSPNQVQLSPYTTTLSVNR